jgi:hypothetical protein
MNRESGRALPQNAKPAKAFNCTAWTKGRRLISPKDAIAEDGLQKNGTLHQYIMTPGRLNDQLHSQSFPKSTRCDKAGNGCLQNNSGNQAMQLLTTRWLNTFTRSDRGVQTTYRNTSAPIPLDHSLRFFSEQ